MGYVHFVRSPYAHAQHRLRRRLAGGGDRGRLRDADRRRGRDAHRPVLPARDAARQPDQGLRARRRQVRHVGEPVVAVVAETRELARDAADLVEVEYEPLPALVDARARAGRGRAASSTTTPARTSSGTGTFDWGDVDGALTEADRVSRSTSSTSTASPRRRSSATARSSSTTAARGSGRSTRTTSCPASPRSDGPGAARAASTSSASSRRTSAAASATRSRRTRSSSRAACSRASCSRPIQWTEWRTDSSTRRTRTATSAGSTTSRSRSRTTARCSASRSKALDDCGAFPRYEPLGCIIWAQVTPGLYRWRNIRVDFTQVVTNKSPVSPNRGYSRMQQLWLTERIDRHRRARARPRPGRGAQAELRPRRRDAVHDAERLRLRLRRLRPLPRHRARADRLRAVEERARGRQGARQAARHRHRLDARLRHEQLRPVALINPELQFSGNNEVATVKLDIFGEIVVTLGTVAAGAGPRDDRGAGRRRHPRLLARRRPRPGRATTATGTRTPGFSGTYASQFAVTGLGGGQGRDREARARDPAGSRRRSSAATPDERRRSRAAGRSSRTTRRRRSRSWRAARSSTRTTPASRRSSRHHAQLPLRLPCRRSRCRTSSGSTAT